MATQLCEPGRDRYHAIGENMEKSEKAQFGQYLTAVMELYGHALTPSAAAIWWSALESHSLDDVRSALSAHVKDPDRGRFAPKPADVIAQMPRDEAGWPDSDEAWAIVAPALADERITMVACPEIMQAFAVALNLSDDPIAARMAFRSAYAPRMHQAKREGRRPNWTPSLGWDMAGREAPLRDAVRLGRLSVGRIDGLIPEDFGSNMLGIWKPSKNMPIAGDSRGMEGSQMGG